MIISLASQLKLKSFEGNSKETYQNRSKNFRWSHGQIQMCFIKVVGAAIFNFMGMLAR
jgi:hypothetical protein